MSVTYTTAHSNASSFTHWAGPGVEPVSSWILVGFINHWAMTGTPPCLFFFCFLGLYLWDMEVPKLGVKSELQLLAYAMVTVTRDLSCVFDLHHSSQQHRILHPLSENRDWTHNLMVSSQIHFCFTTMGTPKRHFWINKIKCRMEYRVWLHLRMQTVPKSLYEWHF